jgi:hypothetical protein
VHTIGYWWAVAGLDYFTEYAAAVRAVTREDVHAFASRWIRGQPRVTGVLVAPGERHKLGPWAQETNA